MNKRQAKKGVHFHGEWKILKKGKWIYQPPYTIPRHRQKLKWIKRQWTFERSVKECGTDE